MARKSKHTAYTLAQQLKVLIDERTQGKRRDLDVAIIKRQFTQLIDAHPISSHAGLALIATYLNKNESLMREHALQTIQHSKNNPIFLYNFAVLLLKFKKFDEVRTVLTQAFELVQNDTKILKNIAVLAYSLSSENLFYALIEKANTLNTISDFIAAIAYEISLANTQDEQEICATLDSIPNNLLHSAPYIIENTAWDNIITVAEKTASAQNPVYALHLHPLFHIRFFRLYQEVKELKKQNSPDLQAHPKIQLYYNIVSILQALRENPTNKEYILQQKMPQNGTDWKCAKNNLQQGCRIFFTYSAEHNSPTIFIALMHTAHALKEQETKAECSTIFEKLLDGRDIPLSYEELVDRSIIYE